MANKNEDIIKKIKEQITFEEIAHEFGLSIKKGGSKWLAVEGEYNSLKINQQSKTFKRFSGKIEFPGTKASGDIIEFYRHLTGKSFKETIQILGKRVDPNLKLTDYYNDDYPKPLSDSMRMKYIVYYLHARQYNYYGDPFKNLLKQENETRATQGRPILYSYSEDLIEEACRNISKYTSEAKHLPSSEKRNVFFDNNKRSHAMIRYLKDIRKIDIDIIRDMMCRKKLIQISSTYPKKICSTKTKNKIMKIAVPQIAFIGYSPKGYDDTISIRDALEPSQFAPNEKYANFKGTIPNGFGKYGDLYDPEREGNSYQFNSNPFNKNKTLIVCESIIEYMSLMSLLKIEKIDPNQFTYLACNSISNTQYITKWCEEVGYQNVVLSFNNDQFGHRESARKVLEEYNKQNKYSSIFDYLTSESSYDIDQLKQKLTEKKISLTKDNEKNIEKTIREFSINPGLQAAIQYQEQAKKKNINVQIMLPNHFDDWNDQLVSVRNGEKNKGVDLVGERLKGLGIEVKEEENEFISNPLTQNKALEIVCVECCKAADDERFAWLNDLGIDEIKNILRDLSIEYWKQPTIQIEELIQNRLQEIEYARHINEVLLKK